MLTSQRGLTPRRSKRSGSIGYPQGGDATVEVEGQGERGAKNQPERNARGISRLSQSRCLSLRAVDGWGITR